MSVPCDIICSYLLYDICHQCCKGNNKTLYLCWYFKLRHRGKERTWYDRTCHFLRVCLVASHSWGTVYDTCENTVRVGKAWCKGKEHSCGEQGCWSHRELRFSRSVTSKVPEVVAQTSLAIASLTRPGPFLLTSPSLAFHLSTQRSGVHPSLSPHTTGITQGPHHRKRWVSDTGWGFWVQV